jgi:hypothetical protein
VPKDTRPARAWRAFRRWYHRRPFWGGLLLILSGLELLYSGNLNLGNIQVHLGLIGFKSYIIPLVVLLCGALAWATPSQRLFYGIIGCAAAIYSLVAVNIGGFFIGLLLGIFGGAVTIAWVPDKRRFRGTTVPAASPDGPSPDDVEPEPDGQTALIPFQTSGDPVPEGNVPVPEGNVPDERDNPRHSGAAQNVEGEQRQPFRRHRHPVEDTPGGNERGPRATAVGVVALTLAASVALGVHDAAPAAADTCTPTPLQSAISRVLGSSSAKSSSGTTKSTSRTSPAGSTTHRSTGAVTSGGATTAHGTSGGSAAASPGPSHATTSSTAQSGTASGATGSQPKPVASLVGGVLGLLGVTPADTTTPSASPSDPPSTPPAPPTTAPAPDPSPSASAPSATGTTKPTPTASASKPSTTAQPTTPPDTATSKPPLCQTSTKTLATAAGQPKVNVVPSTQKAALLTMHGLSYDGNVDLPTANGTIEAMKFSMTSSTSTPFELDVPVGDHSVVIKSSSLTVSGAVSFYTSEIKGNLGGTLAVDFTPSSPPPVTTPELFFTDAVISLVFVQSTTLTADNLTISPT